MLDKNFKNKTKITFTSLKEELCHDENDDVAQTCRI